MPTSRSKALVPYHSHPCSRLRDFRIRYGGPVACPPWRCLSSANLGQYLHQLAEPQGSRSPWPWQTPSHPAPLSFSPYTHRPPVLVRVSSLPSLSDPHVPFQVTCPLGRLLQQLHQVTSSIPLGRLLRHPPRILPSHVLLTSWTGFVRPTQPFREILATNCWYPPHCLPRQPTLRMLPLSPAFLAAVAAWSPVEATVSLGSSS